MCRSMFSGLEDDRTHLKRVAPFKVELQHHQVYRTLGQNIGEALLLRQSKANYYSVDMPTLLYVKGRLGQYIR